MEARSSSRRLVNTPAVIMGASTDTARIDLDTNPWDQATFMGELQMFVVTMIT